MTEAFRIILADDEPDLLESYQSMLHSLGHEVIAMARDGDELIDLCLSMHPDLVITDIKMPGKDGIQAVLEIFRKHPMRVILVTGYHAPDHIHDALGQMVLAYLAKPFRHRDLESAIWRAEQRFAEFRALLDGHDDPQQAVKHRELLRLAKGVLMKKALLSDREAFLRLRGMADEQNVRLADVAQQIVAHEQSGNAASDPMLRRERMPNCV